MVTTGGPVFLLVIAVPAVLLMAAGGVLVGVALRPAAGACWVLVGADVMLPGAPSRRFPSGRRPQRSGEAAVERRELLHVVLPRVHLERQGERAQPERPGRSPSTAAALTAACFCRLSGDGWDLWIWGGGV